MDLRSIPAAVAPDDAASPDAAARITRLEAEIEALAQSAERCRKIALAARFAIVLGAVGWAAMVLGVWRFGGAPLIFSTAAILGGVVLYGANRSTGWQVADAAAKAEAARAELIAGMRLRVVGGTDVE